MNNQVSLEKITALAKRRGFVYPSSDIYGGLANSWDFGHYGVLLKNNIINLWRKKFISNRDDMVGIEASIFLNPKVWQASGHTANFADAMIDCKNCHYRTRADTLIEDKLKDVKVEGKSLTELDQIIVDNKINCPKCGKSEFTLARKFNLLFESSIGVLADKKSTVYLRGEIAQGIFINFKNVIDTVRVRIPFGIGQIGKAFRNEITMGQFVHRSLEFDLVEFEYFIKQEDWKSQFEYWQNQMWQFALDLGLDKNNLRWREHDEDERVFYSSKTIDIEYQYPFGWKEIFGLAYRTDYDLKNHSEKSGKDLNYKDPKTGEKYLPHVIEPTFGISRLAGVILFNAYREDTVNGNVRTYLKLDPLIAPVKAAVFPLQKDEKLQNKAKEIYCGLKQKFIVEFDDSGNIGKMYRRQDEIGTPYCITVDYQTLEDNTVTIRDRDTMEQERVEIDKINLYISKAVEQFRQPADRQ